MKAIYTSRNLALWADGDVAAKMTAGLRKARAVRASLDAHALSDASIRARRTRLRNLWNKQQREDEYRRREEQK